MGTGVAIHWDDTVIGLVGLVVSIVGLAATYYQARKAATASQAARRAVENAQQDISVKQLMVLIPRLESIASHLDIALDGDDLMWVRRNLDSWRLASASAAGLLKNHLKHDGDLLENLKSATMLSAIAVEELRRSGDIRDVPSAGAMRARESIAIASQELLEWMSGQAIETQKES